ncbi:hypothetical protein PENTCL1PPCAC_4320, partial [Pristionchus entomophagus]
QIMGEDASFLSESMTYESTSTDLGEQLFCCPLCKITPKKGKERSLRNLQTHLRIHHKKTARTANLNFACACGFVNNNFVHTIGHRKKCQIFSISIIKSMKGTAPTASLAPLKCYRSLSTSHSFDEGEELYSGLLNVPSPSSHSAEQFVCPFCRRPVERTLSNLQSHLVNHHRRTVKQAGLCLVCTCGYITQTVCDVNKHRKGCQLSCFTLHHAEEVPRISRDSSQN